MHALPDHQDDRAQPEVDCLQEARVRVHEGRQQKQCEQGIEDLEKIRLAASLKPHMHDLHYK
jgi:hypothetical protein